MSQEAPRFYVYTYYDPRTTPPTPIYVGKGTRGRSRRHLKESHNNGLSEAISTMRAEGYEPLIQVSSLMSEEKALSEEMSLISACGLHKNGTGSLYNVAPKGWATAMKSQRPLPSFLVGRDAWDSSSLRAWRQRLGLTQEKAAELLAMPRDSYSSIETGRRPLKPDVVNLALIMEKYAQEGRFPSAIHVIGGGTVSYIRNHFAFCAPAYGTAAKEIAAIHARLGQPARVHLTRMADPSSAMETNADVGRLLEALVADASTRMIYLNAALCDFDGSVEGGPSGKHAQRLRTREGAVQVEAVPAPKVIGMIRAVRKDIFAVGFKSTTGATPDEQYLAALNLLKANSLNLVLANDTVTRLCMVVTPEEARYHVTTDRAEALEGLVEMASLRSRCTFTRSTVVPGESVPWSSPEVPSNLRDVVDHLIARGAYKPFRGATVGHFATRLGEGSILTSKRKHDFNRLAQEGMVRVDYEGRGRVVAHGFKPSVGGQSQRVIFEEHPEADCIAHFHCPMRADAPDAIPHVDQRPNECGSTQCGEATSRGLRDFGGVKAVMLDEHGPNLVFSRGTPAEQVIGFIERNFDLSAKTGGAVS